MFLNSIKPTIVIAGAGFGGLRAALDLNRAFKKNPGLAREYNLYLIDQNDHHLFTPSVYEMAVTLFDDARAEELKKAVTLPLYPALRRKGGASGPLKFHRARITQIDPHQSKLLLNDHAQLKFDYLIVALGAETNFYNIPGLKEKALTLTNLNSAVRIRNELEKKFAAALDRKKVFNAVLGGGGVTGVELAGELSGYFKKLNRKYGAKVKPNITIIESRPDILPGFHPRLARWARERLEKLGVKIAAGDLIEEIRFESALTKLGRRFDFDVLIWAGGIKPNHLADDLPFKKDPRGRVMVKKNFCPVFDPALAGKGGVEAASVETDGECSNVLIIGDNCCLMERGRALPQTAQLAIDEGAQAAKIILAKIQKQPPPAYRPIPNRYILPVGGKFALADFNFIKLKGIFPWLIKELVFLRYLISVIGTVKAIPHWTRALNLFIKND